MESELPDSLITWALPVAPNDPKKTRKLRQKCGAPLEDEPKPQVSDVLTRFIDNREWVDASGTAWVQEASPEPASRLDAVILEEKLDKKLRESGAHPTGICPTRREHFQECFSEVIRQITADSVERGILLHKVREEREATIRGYEELLESRAGYAFRIALKGEKDHFRVRTRIQELKALKAELLEEEERLKAEEQRARQEGEEMLKEEDKRRREELGMLGKESHLKKTQLEAITVLPRK